MSVLRPAPRPRQWRAAVLGDGNGNIRVPGTAYVWLRLDRASGPVTPAVLDPRVVGDDADLPAEGTHIAVVPDGSRPPVAYRVLTDSLPST